MANILVIDDEPVLLDLISNTLRLDGHQVAAISEPLKALDYFKNGDSPVDMLITDVELKPLSGFEMVKRLNNMGFTGPVLFISGHSNLAGAIADSLGARSVIEKPFTASRFRAAVRSALVKRKVTGHRTG